MTGAASCWDEETSKAKQIAFPKSSGQAGLTMYAAIPRSMHRAASTTWPTEVNIIMVAAPRDGSPEPRVKIGFTAVKAAIVKYHRESPESLELAKSRNAAAKSAR